MKIINKISVWICRVVQQFSLTVIGFYEMKVVQSSVYVAVDDYRSSFPNFPQLTLAPDPDMGQAGGTFSI